MDSRIWRIILAAAAGLIGIGAVAGYLLESAGRLDAETIGAQGILVIKIFHCGLFLLLGFALVPLVVRYFIRMQIRIGNGARLPIRWLRAHEAAVVYGFWCLIVVGVCLALPAALKDGFFK